MPHPDQLAERRLGQPLAFQVCRQLVHRLADMHDRYILVKYDYLRREFLMRTSGIIMFAMRLAEIRRRKGFSQAKLGEAIGVEQATISRLENGYNNVTLGIVRRAADALEVPLSEIFSDPRSELEDQLIDFFRSLPPDRQQGWLDMARLVAEPQASPKKERA